ncbi:MAG: adenylate kinase [Elusimicrobiota bacterium]|jgi:adenylate kinase
MNVILLGAPGSGKGTQAAGLSKKYGMVHISTGDIFREEISKETELGVQVQDYLKSGRLVPDELTVEIVKARLGRPDCRTGFLMDGFPRTVGQAEALDNYLSSVKWKLDAVVSIDLSEEEAVRRLSSRRQCETCKRIYNLQSQPPREPEKCDADGGKLIQREDDFPSTVKKRLMVFQDLTQPLIAYYHAAGIVKTVDGNGPVDQVTRAIHAALDGAR